MTIKTVLIKITRLKGCSYRKKLMAQTCNKVTVNEQFFSTALLLNKK